MGIHIHLEQFEGPLALLLHLIRKEEMDIFDINIYAITKQYLDYIKLMQSFDLEVAGEFVAMAATLIQIKSKMLLPHYDEEGEVIDVEDPRKALVNQLLEYQKYQEASHKLYERPLVGRDVWLRGERFKYQIDKNDEKILTEDNALFSLISMYRKVVRDMKKKKHLVTQELQSIAERIMEIKEKFVLNKLVLFSDLLDEKSRANHSYTADKHGTVVQQSLSDQVLITFLCLLELGKMGFVRLFQNENFADIHITPQKNIDHNVLERVEDYQGGGGFASLNFDDKIDEVNEEETDQTSNEDQREEGSPQLSLVKDQSLSEEDVLVEESASDDDILLAEKELYDQAQNEQDQESLQSDIELITNLNRSEEVEV